MALKSDEPKAIDSTLPETEIVTQRAGSYISSFKKALEAHPNRYAAIPHTSEFGGSDGGDSNKRPKVSKGRASKGVDELEKTILASLKAKDGGKGVTNDALKDYLKQKGQSGLSAKKKADLLALCKELLLREGKA